MVHAWFPDRAVYFAGNAAVWSLSCEAFFYLVFPLVAVWASRRVDLGWLVIGATLVSLVVTSLLLGPSGGSKVGEWYLAISPIKHLPEFMAGVWAASMFNADKFPRLPLGPVVALNLGAIVATGWAFTASGQPVGLVFGAIGFVPSLALIVALAQRDESGKGTWLATRPAVWLGAISYCLYLVHVPVSTFVLRRLDLPPETFVFRRVGEAAAMSAGGRVGRVLPGRGRLDCRRRRAPSRRRDQPSDAYVRKDATVLAQKPRVSAGRPRATRPAAA